MGISFTNKNPYPSYRLWWLETIAFWMMKPTQKITDKIGYCILPTSIEKNNMGKVVGNGFAALFWMLLLVISFPIYVSGMMLWLGVQGFKDPYRLSKSVWPRFMNMHSVPSITVVTANLCLLPEFLSRLHNLGSGKMRAWEAGQRIVDSQKFQINKPSQVLKLTPPEIIISPTVKQFTSDSQGFPVDEDVSFETSVLEKFRPTDILLVQEAYDSVQVERLRRELHRTYAWIVYDCGVNSYHSNFWIGLSSGLLIASKHEILDVKFDWFNHKGNISHWSSDGLLQIKIKLGTTKNGQTRVAIVGNTHLQAFPRNHPVQLSQLMDIYRWSEVYRNELTKNERLQWHVIGGDFNLDNMSPSDCPASYHIFFADYNDPAVYEQGSDYEWAVGTQLRHSHLNDDYASSTYGLMKILNDAHLMQYYLVDSDIINIDSSTFTRLAETDSENRMIESPVGGRRRVDRIFLWREKPMEVQSVNAVSQLGGLTDHIPYSITFSNIKQVLITPGRLATRVKTVLRRRSSGTIYCVEEGLNENVNEMKSMLGHRGWTQLATGERRGWTRIERQTYSILQPLDELEGRDEHSVDMNDEESDNGSYDTMVTVGSKFENEKNVILKINKKVDSKSGSSQGDVEEELNSESIVVEEELIPIVSITPCTSSVCTQCDKNASSTDIKNTRGQASDQNVAKEMMTTKLECESDESESVEQQCPKRDTIDTVNEQTDESSVSSLE